TVLNNWKQLEEYGIIKVTRQFGKTKLYTLDEESKTTKALLRLEMALADHAAPKQKAKIKAQSRV
ncbi:MAG: hypothetical protein ABIH42_11250, partial [Planctomycetota bacterium]